MNILLANLSRLLDFKCCVIMFLCGKGVHTAAWLSWAQVSITWSAILRWKSFVPLLVAFWRCMRLFFLWLINIEAVQVYHHLRCARTTTELVITWVVYSFKVLVSCIQGVHHFLFFAQSWQTCFVLFKLCICQSAYQLNRRLLRTKAPLLACIRELVHWAWLKSGMEATVII